jgi:hypothetical protein
MQGLCDVKWDSGNKPEIDNTYFVYHCGNDGLYHLALADKVIFFSNLQKAAATRSQSAGTPERRPGARLK